MAFEKTKKISFFYQVFFGFLFTTGPSKIKDMIKQMKIKVFLSFFMLTEGYRSVSAQIITDQDRILGAQKLTDPDLEYYSF
jgi:hypothetical protein